MLAGIAFAAGCLACLITPAAAQPPPVPQALLAAYQLPPATLADPAAPLGKLLFFDPMLSGNGAIACATCHNPGLSWGNGLARGIGDLGQPMPLRSPTLIDVAALDIFGWDGKFDGLEAVTFAAMASRGNMNLPQAAALARLQANAGYAAQFRALFPDQGITRQTVEQAIAAYERTIIARDAPFDRFVRGDRAALGDAAVRGFLLFNGAARCAACHNGWAFTDGSFHDIGTATGEDIGRGRLFPTSVKLRYAFKTPSLRDVSRRAPYMHDGSIATLGEVLDLYQRGGIDRPSRDVLLHPLALSAQDRQDLLAFLDSLTDQAAPVTIPVLPR